MKVASEALTTEAQALIPQAQGTSAARSGAEGLEPEREGHSEEEADGREQRQRHGEARGGRPALRRLEHPGQEPEIGTADDDNSGRSQNDGRPLAGPARESIDRARAQASEDQEAGEHHRDGIERMPEEHREALHERDLDEEERQSQAREEEHDAPPRGRLRT